MLHHAVSQYAFNPASSLSWNPFLKCYTGHAWSYGANAWVPCMSPVPVGDSRRMRMTESRSSSCSSYSYSYSSSRASSYSAASGVESIDVRYSEKKRKSIPKMRSRERSHSRRKCERSRSRLRSRRSSSRGRKAATMLPTVCRSVSNRRIRRGSRSPSRRSDTARKWHGPRRRCERFIPRDQTLRCNLSERDHRHDRKVRSDAPVPETKHSDAHGNARLSSSNWSSWNWRRQTPWWMAKKRDNKKRGGWRVQAKRAAMSMRTGEVAVEGPVAPKDARGSNVFASVERDALDRVETPSAPLKAIIHGEERSRGIASSSE
jgi:hypothetical protein